MGLAPSWAKTSDFAPHNARAETAAVKPTFRDAWKRHRAVLPVNSWYEWRKQAGRPRTPFLIANAEGWILHLAALWDRWNGPAGTLDGLNVLTTTPRDEVAAIHHRQPAVLESEAELGDWLAPHAPRGRLMTLVARAGTQPLRIHQISAAVNNPRNDSRWILNRTAIPL